MKILIVSSYYPPHLGGLEIVAFNHAKYLAARGNEVTVLTSSVTSDEISCITNGVNVIRVKALNLFENRWGVPYPIFSFKIFPIANQAVKEADVIHVHDAFYLSSFIALMFARWHKKPAVLMQHVEMIKHPNKFVVAVQAMVYASTGAFVFKQSSKIITLNDRVDMFLLNRGISRLKLVALPNGVDAEAFVPVSHAKKIDLRKKLGLSLEKKIVLFVGRFVPKKGFDKLLGAKSNEYQLVFAGGKAKEMSDEKVIFLGIMSQKELVEVYQAADIFVLPSESEGFPLSVQEAMATGLPIITTNDYGYDRYNFDKKMIVLLDAPTSVSIKKAIKDTIQNDSLLESMGSYSRDYVLKNFSWKSIITELENLYRSLI